MGHDTRLFKVTWDVRRDGILKGEGPMRVFNPETCEFEDIDGEPLRLKWNNFVEEHKSLLSKYNVCLNYVYAEAEEHTIDGIDVPLYREEGWNRLP